MAVDPEIIESIRLNDREIEATKHQLDAIKEQITEELESTTEFDAVTEATKSLNEAKGKLKVALMSNGTYNDMLEEKANLAEKMKDLRDIQSDYLVLYNKETDERQIDLGPDNAREVVVKAKLGKRTQYQESLLQ